MNVNIPSPLRSYTGNKATVEGRGTSLIEVLRGLDAQFPGIVFRILDEQGRIRQHIKFYINKEPVSDLSASIDGSDTLHIICALSGG